MFAAGDVRHGSAKRVAGAVGEGSVAVGSVHRYLAAPGPIRRTAHAVTASTDTSWADLGMRSHAVRRMAATGHQATSHEMMVQTCPLSALVGHRWRRDLEVELSCGA